MAGFALGLLMGLVALWCLSRATHAITGGRPERAVLPFFGNVLSIGAALLISVLFLRQQLAYTGIGLAAALVAGSIAVFIYKIKKN